MDDFNALSSAALVSALISLLLAVYSNARREYVAAATAFAVLMTAQTIWSIGYALELASSGLKAKIVASEIAYLGVVLMPPAWLACARRYGGAPPLSRGALLLLSIEPVAILLLLLTNDSHHLFWATVGDRQVGGRSEMVVTYGAAAWTNVAYCYALTASATILLLRMLRHSPRLYRAQAAVLLVGAAAPWVSNALYVLGFQPLPGLELTAFAFSASGLAMAFALFRLKLFEVMPVAQSAIVERIRDGIVVINPEGVVVHVNPAAAAMLGVEARGVVGQPASAAFAEVAALAARFHGEEIDDEVAVGTGEQRILDVRVCALAQSSGSEPGRLLVLRDVTAAKRDELALLLARDEAVAAARTKADFLATMSHEIRTPMNGVIGTTDILLTTRLDSDQRDLANTIRSAADALLGIINSILDFSKVEAGRLELEGIEFSPRRMIEDVVDLFGPRARNQGIELVSSFRGDVPATLRGDGGRLRQVLTNLVSNAVKFTSKGSVSVTCTRTEGPDARIWLKIAVADTGIGISREQKERLFEPFVQADSSMTRRYGGTGLGLAISKRLIELMGGEIQLTSDANLGSTFEITLPFDAGAAVAAQPAAATPDLRRQTALVLQARSATRRALETQLKTWGAAVETAEEAAQAIAILRSAARKRRPYEWFFVDLQSLGEQAYRVLYAVRAESSLKGTRVVLLTDVGRGQDLEELRRRRVVQATLLKPLRESRLAECIHSLVNPEAEPETPPPAHPALVAAAPKAPPPEPPPAPPPALEAARILLVEDNLVNQKVALRMLHDLGHAVEVAENGAKAVEAASNGRFDLIFMDCQMPVLDGFGATTEIRRREPAGQHVAIVAMTANAMEGDRDRCLAAGMDDYLPKPVRRDDVKAVIEKWLPERDSAKTDPAPSEWPAAAGTSA